MLHGFWDCCNCYVKYTYIFNVKSIKGKQTVELQIGLCRVVVQANRLFFFGNDSESSGQKIVAFLFKGTTTNRWS